MKLPGLSSSHVPRDLLPAALSIAAGALLFFYTFGPVVLNPTKVDWLLTGGDPSTYYIGWQFFRQEPWSFPPGAIHGYLAPVGTSIALTDSLPILAFPFKLIHSLLPWTFQYFGLWMLISYCLQGLFGYLLGAFVTENRWIRILVAVFFLISPVMLQRQGGHIALASHWLILAALWLYLRGSRRRGIWRDVTPWALLLVLGCLIHPYLTVMVLGIAGARLLQDLLVEHRIGIRSFLFTGAAYLGLVLGLWLMVGTILGGEAASYQEANFGNYSMNLNAPINPLSTSLFLKSMPLGTPGQYEGYNYFGVGMIAMALLAGCLVSGKRAWRPRLKQYWPLALVLAAYAVFAVSRRICWGQDTILLYPAPSGLGGVLGSLRSSGRFFWPVYYGLFLAFLAIVWRNLDRRAAFSLLAIGVILQFADMQPLLSQQRHFSDRKYDSRLKSPIWQEVPPQIKRVVTYPPLEISTQYDADFRDLGLWAAQHGMSVTAGYAARFAPSLMQEQKQHLDSLFFRGQPDPDAIYLVRSSDLVTMYERMSDRFLCTDIDGYKVCFAPTSPFPAHEVYEVRKIDLAGFLAECGDRFIIAAVKDEAAQSLDVEAKEALEHCGLHLDGLPYRGSYVGIARGGQTLWEMIQADKEITVHFPRDSQLGPWSLSHDLWVHSAGYLVGNSSSIKIDGQEQSFDGRGINMAVLDENQRVWQLAHFDTNQGTMGTVWRMIPRPEALQTPAP